MSLFGIIAVLVVIGVVLWLIQTYIPMAAPIKTVLTVVVVIFLCIWLLSLFGIGDIIVGRGHPLVR